MVPGYFQDTGFTLVYIFANNKTKDGYLNSWVAASKYYV